MPRNRKKDRLPLRWNELIEQLERSLPSVSGWWSDTDSFVELRIKARSDGTMLAIAKGYGGDGGPVVCFASGYGVEATLLAIDASIQGGNWKYDEPWDPKKT